MRLIDADALITELNGIRYPGAPYVDAGIRIAIGKVCDAPTIEERKTGKWIDGKLDWHGIAMERYCSECGQLLTSAKTVHMNYCPYCGADMRGETE